MSATKYVFAVDNESGPLTYLRFADDVLLFASGPGDVAKMITI